MRANAKQRKRYRGRSVIARATRQMSHLSSFLRQKYSHVSGSSSSSSLCISTWHLSHCANSQITPYSCSIYQCKNAVQFSSDASTIEDTRSSHTAQIPGLIFKHTLFCSSGYPCLEPTTSIRTYIVAVDKVKTLTFVQELNSELSTEFFCA